MSTVVNLSSLLFESPIENVRLSLDEAKETIVQEVLSNLEQEGIRLERDEDEDFITAYVVSKPIEFIILDRADNIVERIDTKLQLKYQTYEQVRGRDRLFKVYMNIQKQNENLMYDDDVEATLMDFWDNLITSTQHFEYYRLNPSRPGISIGEVVNNEPEDIISILTNHAINLYNKWFRQTGEIVVNESGRMIDNNE